jgi:hypothetical protein
MRLVFVLSVLGFFGGTAVASLSPRETVTRFDSLMEVGAGEQARALCTGQALRLLPLLIQTQKTFASFVDTARTRDTILGEKQLGDWTALKVRAVAVFNRPLMGMDSLESFQAVHLVRDGGVWKIADFEELSTGSAPLVPRRGVPSGSSAGQNAGVGAGDPNTGASLLPLSPRAPVKTGATRLRLRLSLRGGGALTTLPPSAGQSVVEQGPGWALIETRRAALPDSVQAAKPTPQFSPVYLASTPDLDLSDPALTARAALLKKGSPNALETTRRIYAFVSSSFDYKLGASLFGTSREALRDMKGDCSEAAVLTASLLRATGVPSRVVLGFATLGRGVFIGHAWAEAWLAGAWIGVDPALREFPAGAERVALLRLTGEQRMQPIATNLMLGTLANLDIEIVEAWNGTERVELREQQGTDKDVREFLDKVMEGMGQ